MWKALTAGLFCFLVMQHRVLAETDGSFIVIEFPRCKGEPIFSPYSSGAVGAIEAKQRDEWFAKLKPILGAPCVLPADYGFVTFCGKLVCRNIAIDRTVINQQ